MAKVFQFTPTQTREMDYAQVLEFLHLDNEWRKKESEDIKK